MITQLEWKSIRAMVESVIREMVGGRRDYFVTGKVIKNDDKKNLVWLEEFGDQAIPVVAFDYEITVYDETPKGTLAVAAGNVSPYKTKKKKAFATVMVPSVGETVLVARELGIRRLPRCLGVLQGRDWIISEDES